MQFDWGTRILRVITGGTPVRRFKLHRYPNYLTLWAARRIVPAFSSPADPLWLVGFIYQATAHTGFAFHVSNFTLVENEHGYRRRTQTSHA
jgi:hypothetical protein